MSYRAFLFDSRYNCLLGGITHNKKRIEIQLMKGFCRDLFSDIFDKILVKIKNERDRLCLFGGITHNKKRIEIQLMKGFCRDLFSDIFDKILVKIKNERERL